MNTSHKGSYEEFDDESNTQTRDSLGGSCDTSSGAPSGSLDPGAQIEMSAAVSGVVPDGMLS